MLLILISFENICFLWFTKPALKISYIQISYTRENCPQTVWQLQVGLVRLLKGSSNAAMRTLTKFVFTNLLAMLDFMILVRVIYYWKMAWIYVSNLEASSVLYLLFKIYDLSICLFSNVVTLLTLLISLTYVVRLSQIGRLLLQLPLVNLKRK